MLDRSDIRRHAAPLLPAVSLLFFYILLNEWPRRGELYQLRQTLKAEVTAVEELRTQVTARYADIERSEARMPTPSTQVSSTSVTDRRIAVEGSKRSVVQTFAQVLATFQRHGLKCVATSMGQPDGPKAPKRLGTHCFSLVGGFPPMLAAMKEIGTDLPQIATTELTMKPMAQSDPCVWTVSFKIVGNDQ